MTEFFSIFELRFHTAFEFGDSRQAEFSFLSFLMITQEISHIFCVYRRWNRQNCSILSISNLRLTFLRFSENPFTILPPEGFAEWMPLGSFFTKTSFFFLFPKKNECVGGDIFTVCSTWCGFSSFQTFMTGPIVLFQFFILWYYALV